MEPSRLKRLTRCRVYPWEAIELEGMTPIILRVLSASEQELSYLRSWLKFLHAEWLQDTRRSTQETPRSTQEHPGDTQETPRSTQEHPGDTQKAPRTYPGACPEGGSRKMALQHLTRYPGACPEGGFKETVQERWFCNTSLCITSLCSPTLCAWICTGSL